MNSNQSVPFSKKTIARLAHVVQRAQDRWEVSYRTTKIDDFYQARFTLDDVVLDIYITEKNPILINQDEENIRLVSKNAVAWIAFAGEPVRWFELGNKHHERALSEYLDARTLGID